jgi:hypothetical protein
MAITTTDVVKNASATSETIKNGACVVYCFRGNGNGTNYQSLASTFENTFTYNQLETKFTNRFDDVTYYSIGTSTIVGA